jgi:hypothetical protein
VDSLILESTVTFVVLRLYSKRLQTTQVMFFIFSKVQSIAIIDADWKTTAYKIS